MTLPSAAADTQSGERTPSKPTKWFHFRWRVLLVIPLAILLLAAVYVPRQIAQREAITDLKKLNAIVRTQPIMLPWVQNLFGEEYSQEVVEVYMASPSYADQALEPLEKLSSLQKLELTGASVTSAGLVHLSRLSGLYTLHLSGTKVTDDGLQHVSGLRNLGILSLDNTQITDAGLVHLEALPNLERLFLDHTRITDKGLETIGKLRTLKELALTNTRITDAGVDHLKNLVNLELLKIYDTKVSKPKLMELDEALKNCVLWAPDPGQ